MIRRPRVGLLPAVVLLAYACASAPAGPAARPLELGEWRPPEGQKCEFSGAAPSVAEVLDSAAAVAAIARLAPGDGALLLSLPHDTTEPPTGLWRIETTLDPAHASAIERALQSLRTGVAARLLIRTSGGRANELITGSRQTCRPILVNARALQRVVMETARAGPRGAKANLWFYVREDGSVGEVRVNRSSGSALIDAQFVDAARYARFMPAVVDRKAVAVWVALDLAITRYPRRP